MLRGAHDHARLGAGEQAWETPDIIPLGSWLQRAWNDLLATGDGPHPALLGPRQDLSLWEQVIRHRPPPDGLQPLLQTGAAARNAQAAWSLLRAWRLELDGDLGFPTEEVRAFQAWARDYGARCQADDWLDPAGVADRLAEGLTREALGDTRRVLLAGLDSLTPQQQALVTRLEALGVPIHGTDEPALGRKELRGGAADPARCAGDECCLGLGSAHRSTSSLSLQASFSAPSFARRSV